MLTAARVPLVLQPEQQETVKVRSIEHACPRFYAAASTALAFAHLLPRLAKVRVRPQITGANVVGGVFGHYEGCMDASKRGIARERGENSRRYQKTNNKNEHSKCRFRALWNYAIQSAANSLGAI